MADSTPTGYGTRFQKGRSGNPGGRPRKPAKPLASAFDIVIGKKLPAPNDMARELTVQEALELRTYENAIKGHRMAQRAVLKMIIKRERAKIATIARPEQIVTRRIEPKDPRNADQAMLALGIASRDERFADLFEDADERLILEVWAVQAALSRRRGGIRLSERETDEIKHRTRAAEKLRWPRR